jgi:hypothetical protein
MTVGLAQLAMEQRSESRVQFNAVVMITTLENDDVFMGRFVDLCSKGMRIKSNADLKIGSLLRLEVGDDLIITEVRHCEPDGAEYSTGLSILSWLEKSELKRLLREAVAGPAPERVPDDAKLLAVA